MTAFRLSTLPNMVVSSSCSRASSSGQGYQTAVLWRRTDPEDTHAGGQGGRKCIKTAEQQRCVCLDIQREDCSYILLFCSLQGVTYDTGGADIKAGGCMAGMHRDKCGAAAVAGFFQVNNTAVLLICC